MTELIWDAVIVFNGVVLFYFLSLNSVYLVTSLFAFRALRAYALRMKTLDMEEFLRSGGAPPITLVSPAFNEEATCVESVRSLLTLNYPDFEVLVCNDGSTDDTLGVLRGAFNLEPVERVPMASIPTAEVRGVYRSRRHRNLWVVDKENGGKADALNAAINHSRTVLFCAMDADSLLERNALLRIVRPFLENADTVAAGGIIRIVNGCTVRHGQVEEIGLPKNPLARFQVLEYLRAFLSGRMGWDALDSTLVISGAFGIFDRSRVVEAGGYATDTVGEDMELVVRLHRHCREKEIPYRITFVPDPVAWTECPESLGVLGRQRDRWQRGLYESLIRHRTMLFNPRYGKPGVLAFPYFFFLEMMGPLVEALGYVAFLATVLMGRASTLYVTAFLAVAVVLGVVLSIAAVGLEELSFRRYPRRRDLLKLFLFGVLENFGYRQLNAWWRFRGTIRAVRGKEGWGSMVRKGFSPAEKPRGGNGRRDAG
jgi:cellulose synthase/poly-beta-1,6-N-acetylglucosamine synthase-like glycosyltransferase